MKSQKFASEEEIIEVTGSPMGAVSPFGSIFNVPVWVDRSLSKVTEISFNCGLRTESMVMTYEDYISAESPTVHVFTDEEIALGDIPETTGGTEAPVKGVQSKKDERLKERQKQAQKQKESKV